MPNRSKYWDTMVDILDKQFPKGECKERGKALVMLSYIELMLQGVEFEDGKPKNNTTEFSSEPPSPITPSHQAYCPICQITKDLHTHSFKIK